MEQISRDPTQQKAFLITYVYQPNHGYISKVEQKCLNLIQHTQGLVYHLSRAFDVFETGSFRTLVCNYMITLISPTGWSD